LLLLRYRASFSWEYLEARFSKTKETVENLASCQMCTQQHTKKNRTQIARNGAANARKVLLVLLIYKGSRHIRPSSER
jgi:hypothetical protein